jgi:proline dehydrogenase
MRIGGLLRRTLLWMAGDAWLRGHVPRLWFVRRAIRRFMPGEDAEAAIRAAASFESAGIGTVFTRLGENVTRIDEADEVADHYLQLIAEIAERKLDGEISVKLTQLGLDLDVERAYVHLDRLTERARASGKAVWIDMEGSAYTERTVALYERLRSAHSNAGLCLQAYLRRTASDIRRLLPLEPAIRLVKGAYAEPAAIAYQTRREVDESYHALTVMMLDARQAGRALRIALGTHDIQLVERAAAFASAHGSTKSAFEVHMLYGIRPDEQHRLARAGYAVRTLIAYGAHWYPWYMRRLAERPANIWFVLRQMLP